MVVSPKLCLGEKEVQFLALRILSARGAPLSVVSSISFLPLVFILIQLSLSCFAYTNCSLKI